MILNKSKLSSIYYKKKIVSKIFIDSGYYLDQLTYDNGPIAIVPGSQNALFKPPINYQDFPDQKLILAMWILKIYYQKEK